MPNLIDNGQSAKEISPTTGHIGAQQLTQTMSAGVTWIRRRWEGAVGASRGKPQRLVLPQEPRGSAVGATPGNAEEHAQDDSWLFAQELSGWFSGCSGILGLRSLLSVFTDQVETM